MRMELGSHAALFSWHGSAPLRCLDSASSQPWLIPFLGERPPLGSTAGLAKAPSSEGPELQDPVCLDPGLELSEAGSGGRKGHQSHEQAFSSRETELFPFHSAETRKEAVWALL